MNNINNIRRIFLALSACLIAILCVSCSDSSSTAETKPCFEPENPYNEDTGHYAGFNWAQEMGKLVMVTLNHSMRAVRNITHNLTLMKPASNSLNNQPPSKK
jgi:hypothetical protein